MKDLKTFLHDEKLEKYKKIRKLFKLMQEDVSNSHHLSDGYLSEILFLI